MTSLFITFLADLYTEKVYTRVGNKTDKMTFTNEILYPVGIGSILKNKKPISLSESINASITPSKVPAKPDTKPYTA